MLYLTINNCTGDGTISVTVKDGVVSDKVDLKNSGAVTSAKADANNHLIIDNTAPKVTITSPTNPGSTVAGIYENKDNTETAYKSGDVKHYNSRYANYEHKIVYVVTIEDTNLLYSTSASSSNNYGETVHNVGVELLYTELTAVVSGGKNNGSCAIHVASIVNGSSKIKFTQIVTLTKCEGDGTLTLTVKGGATKYDNGGATINLAGNTNTPSTSNTDIIIDNTAPVVTIIPPTSPGSTVAGIYEGDGTDAYDSNDVKHYNSKYANNVTVTRIMTEMWNKLYQNVNKFFVAFYIIK